MTTIPSAPEPGAEFTNEATGVTYRFDGQRWIAVSSTADDVIDGITDEIGKLNARIDTGETVQSGIQQALVDLEASIPSSDEFYLKTGGDINGYVYTKGNTAGYYLGSQDGDNLISLTEKAAQEANLQLRGRTTFKVTGYAPGDNQAFPYVNLDTSVADGLQISRLSDPVQSTDAANKRYVDNELNNRVGQRSKPDGPKPWKYVPPEKWNPATAQTGTFTVDREERKIYMNCHDIDGRWWVFRNRQETFSSPYPHFTMYAAAGTMVLDCNVTDVHYYESIGDKRITTLTYYYNKSYSWDSYVKEGHHFMIHWQQYLPNFRERHISDLNPPDSTFTVPEPDGVQLDDLQEI